ncbi:MAG: hypothetical protein JW742_07295, partial [Candidatus Aminicenantes bacterium]|nr:hypothetical protein [Candidatus Aminicenantes bacterium]
MTQPHRMPALLALIALVTLFTGVAAGQAALDESIIKSFRFRNLGPFRAGSWVTAIAVPETPLREHLYT